MTIAAKTTTTTTIAITKIATINPTTAKTKRKSIERGDIGHISDIGRMISAKQSDTRISSLIVSPAINEMHDRVSVLQYAGICCSRQKSNGLTNRNSCHPYRLIRKLCTRAFVRQRDIRPFEVHYRFLVVRTDIEKVFVINFSQLIHRFVVYSQVVW